MVQLGKKIGKESLAKRQLFSLLLAEAGGGAAAFFAFFAARAGEAATTAMRTANANFFIVFNPPVTPRISVAIHKPRIA
jgi:hypothetical protein